MKKYIKQSLLSLILFCGAANIQASVEEEQGGGGAAAVADQETPPVERMKKLVLHKVKAAMKEILINWPATVDKAVEMVGDKDGSIRTAMNMMFESFPENVELTADVLEILVDAALNKLMDDPEANIKTTIFNLDGIINLDSIITNVIANYTESRLILYRDNYTHSSDENLLNSQVSFVNAFLKTITTTPTRDILLKKIVKIIYKHTANLYLDQLNANKQMHDSIGSDYTIIPTDEKLAAIIEQSQTRHKIIFLKSEEYACWMGNDAVFIEIPENYVPAAILHEIGHIENETFRTLNDLNVKLLKIIEQIIESELSIENKLKQLLTTDLIMLSVSKKEERDADSFALQKATKKQLTEFIDFFLNKICLCPEKSSFDDYLEIKRRNLNTRLDNEQIVQMTCNFYRKIYDIFGIKYNPKILTQQLCGILGIEYDPKRSTQQLCGILGTKNFLAYLEFFRAVHPSHYSRMTRMQKRIAELDAENPLEPCLAQLKTEAEAISVAERKFDFAQKSMLEKLLAKITRCRYLRFLAGAKKAPREQLRARL